MTREPLPSWLQTCGEVAAQISELLARLEQPFADMADDEEPDQVRVVACLTEARSILTHEWTHRVPAGLIGLGVNHARRIVQNAGLTVRLARQGGVPLVRPLGPGTWVVIHTTPAAGNYMSRGDEVVLVVAERGSRRPDGSRL
jgi:hypothetical protein